MKRHITNDPAGPRRRFLLVPEEAADVYGEAVRIRRYHLASIGGRAGTDGMNLAAARLMGELGRQGHTR